MSRIARRRSFESPIPMTTSAETILVFLDGGLVYALESLLDAAIPRCSIILTSMKSVPNFALATVSEYFPNPSSSTDSTPKDSRWSLPIGFVNINPTIFLVMPSSVLVVTSFNSIESSGKSSLSSPVSFIRVF